MKCVFKTTRADGRHPICLVYTQVKVLERTDLITTKNNLRPNPVSLTLVFALQSGNVTPCVILGLSNKAFWGAQRGGWGRRRVDSAVARGCAKLTYGLLNSPYRWISRGVGESQTNSRTLVRVGNQFIDNTRCSFTRFYVLETVSQS